MAFVDGVPRPAYWTIMHCTIRISAQYNTVQYPTTWSQKYTPPSFESVHVLVSEMHAPFVETYPRFPRGGTMRLAVQIHECQGELKYCSVQSCRSVIFLVKCTLMTKSLLTLAVVILYMFLIVYMIYLSIFFRIATLTRHATRAYVIKIQVHQKQAFYTNLGWNISSWSQINNKHVYSATIRCIIDTKSNDDVLITWFIQLCM